MERVLIRQSLSPTPSAWQLRRLLCNRLHKRMPPELTRSTHASLPLLLYHGENANLEWNTTQKAHFPRIPHKQAQTSIYAHTKSLVFAKMKLSSCARRFIANGVSPNYIPHKIWCYKNLSRSLAHMVTDFRTISDKMCLTSSKSAACVYGRRLRQCL